MAKWIGVDLDGTLAKSVSTMTGGIGEPVPSMLTKVKDWLQRGQPVRIFTARAGDPKQVRAIRAWLRQHDIDKCGITDRKDLDMIELWDDKARRVEKDTGKVCSGCRPKPSNHSSLDGAVVFTDC
ncbi:hypothetical protein [Kushneria phyllosphaerae]|uniref:Uncharacterized protein n=1 Tax=Kushneria phyllosphaerae TaxID=2100822 RepID=A0A2R8CQU1_9GAMM|nr:hypothetical protein [Kushneria phyllosphaerae]SPJ35266.1 hypothetical protein KSP9073_03324 [Kushneria phyllosphaerae]